MMMGEQLVLEEDYDENYKPTEEGSYLWLMHIQLNLS